VGNLLSPATLQGQLALTFFQLSAFLILLVLLVLFLILYKDVHARFLRLWITGWMFLTVSSASRLIQQLHDNPLEFAFTQTCFFSAVCFFMASILIFLQSERRLRLLWLCWPLGGVVTGVLTSLSKSTPFFFQWLPALLAGGMALAGGLILWRTRFTRHGHGIPLMAGALLLAGLHHMDRPFWNAQQFAMLRMAFGSMLQVALGIGMVVLILETSRERMEDLNDKLRRLTLITAASSQSMSVDEVLQEVLGHLVETLGASHGVARILTSTGASPELEIRASVGFDESHLAQNKRTPVTEPCARAVLDREQPWICFTQHDAPDGMRQCMEMEAITAMAFVRLPGKSAPVGVLGIGSTTSRDFQGDEIAFLVNVANLLGLTIQNLQLFEHAAAAERQWSNTFDSIGDPILVHDENSRTVRVNHALAVRLGKSPDELRGLPLADYMRTDGLQWVSCPYCEGIAGKGDAPDPSLGGHLLVSNSDFHDPAGHRLGVVHVLKDISDRQQAEDKYRTLFTNMQEGVFISSPEGRFLDFNDTFLRMSGYGSREELLAVDDIAGKVYVSPSDRARLQRLLREHGAVNDFEFQMRRKDGEILTVLESSVATRDKSGKIVAIQGFVLDITERKNAEHEIRRRNRELMILNSIGQTLNQPLELEDLLGRALRQVVDLFDTEIGSIFLLEGDGVVLRRAAATGLRSEYARSFPPTEMPADLIEHIRAVHATVLSVAGLPLPPVFNDLQLKEGLEESSVVLLWSKDSPIGCLFLGSRKARDFSSAETNLLISVSNQIAATIEKMLLLNETRQAYENLSHTQEQLLQSEKMAAIGQLISGVAHELNNPLTAILGFAQLLTTNGLVNERGAEYVEKLHKQARRTHRIVNNLLSFARQQKPERLPVRINQVVEDTLALREYDLRVNNIIVHRELGPNLPLIGADAHQLQQVFLNILNNAVDAVLERSDRGEIWARTAQEDDQIIVEFTDSGPGIQDTHRVFDPFYTTKPVGKGTGLGLSICYGIISEHGGEISVRNAPPHGASVKVAFPALPTRESGSKEREEKVEELVLGGRVLVVDDEEAVLELEREILVGRRLSVITARSGREAVDLLERERVDLVVTDLKMPGEVTGRTLYEWIRAHRPELAHRVVFMMSDANSNESADLLERTGCPNIQKPFEVESFWQVIRGVLRQPESAAIKP
jgi:two-component system NtrC family sensor kinase